MQKSKTGPSMPLLAQMALILLIALQMSAQKKFGMADHITSGYEIICKQLFVLARLEGDFESPMGTSENCQQVIDVALRKLSTKGKPLVDYCPSCNQLNMSQCEITEGNGNFIITVYNPLGRTVNHNVRIPVTGVNYKVIDHKGNEVPYQLVPLPEDLKHLPGRVSTAEQELLFIAQDIPLLGYLSFYVIKSNDASSRYHNEHGMINKDTHSIIIGTDSFSIDIDENSGLLKSLQIDGRLLPITQSFFISYDGSTQIEVPHSVGYEVIRGELVEEVRQVFNEWINQVVRVYLGQKLIEFEWIIEPRGDRIGKNVITKYTTELETNGLFYIDSNGREMLKRKSNNRPQDQEYDFGNYYPINSRITIEDEKQQIRLTAFTDRSQRGTSPNDGEIEIMGLDGRGTHRLMFTVNEESKKQEVLQAELMQLSPIVFPAVTTVSAFEWLNSFTNKFSGLSFDLPENVHLLTLEPWKENVVLLRLEHPFGKDNSKLGGTVKINLMNLFHNLKILSIRETTIEMDKMIEKWNIESDINSPETNFVQSATHRSSENNIEQMAPHKIVLNKELDITLEPMQIRTFIIVLKPEGPTAPHNYGFSFHWLRFNLLGTFAFADTLMMFLVFGIAYIVVFRRYSFYYRFRRTKIH